MHLSQLLFILVNLLPYIGLVFGDSTQECGLFFGPSRIDGKYICQNSGRMAYLCAPPQFPKIPLDNCVPYVTAPALTGVDTQATQTHQDCDTAKKHDDERYINCGMLAVLATGNIVSTAFRCEYNNWNLNVAYECKLIADHSIEYEVDYQFPEYRDYLIS
ncbi:uncharacterized protein MELLADRAFT_124224 [Melampsora larici-populina 98AG31]|uniref:Secreted protein n=1 Tax=Melampsora larici-populina (strain 98AG31 / pathotype 3-4-7) TaxID=747676 RepID=F4S8M3_MELLP|nr:uncharacterized protein MELLADRAFT_124224 [Melampsora larici-populina 98AG31]EGF99046.1 secreted protein [Melampsora larici-populina 98AG31]